MADIELTTLPDFAGSDGRLLIFDDQFVVSPVLASVLISYHRAASALNLVDGSGNVSFTYEDVFGMSEQLTDVETDLSLHLSYDSLHLPSGGLSHTALLDKGTLSHSELEAALDIVRDTSYSHTLQWGNGGHIPVSGLSHTALLDKGLNSHAQIDSHLFDTAKHLSPLAWAALSLQNNWVNFGGDYQTGQYCKTSDGEVVLRGLIKSGLLNQVACQLPVGFRPSGRLVFTVSTTTTVVARVDVDTSGNVWVLGGGYSVLSLQGVRFFV